MSGPSREFRAYAPASIGNVAAGFDVLGAALAPVDGTPWGDVVTAGPAAADVLRCEGPYAGRLPADPDQNLVAHAKARFESELGRPLPPMALTLHKGLPVNSGLGSSSTSIVAALLACNAFAGEPLSTAELLRLAGELEGANTGAVHLDNVAPCLLGGLRMIAVGGEAPALPWPEGLLFVVAHPALELSTAASRAALPAAVPLRTAVAHAQNLATLVHALHARELPLLRASLRDLLAEPHRAPLVAGFREAQAAALAAGAWGCSLSGSGPSVFAVAPEPGAARVAEALGGVFEAAIRICRLDMRGARVLG